MPGKTCHFLRFGLRGFFLLLALVQVAGSGTVWADPVVERISFEESSEGLSIRIHASERIPIYSEPRYLSGNRVEIILFNTVQADLFRREDPAGAVQTYTLIPNKGHLFLHFQLVSGLQVQAKASRDRGSDDLLLKISYPHGFLPVRRASVPSFGGMESAGQQEARERWRFDTVVIDAGHGGEDTGAIGYGGIQEKDLVLPVAQRLGVFLEEYLGLHVVYTREADYFVTLQERGKIANRVGGKLFISIHANAARNRQAVGTETYFLGLHKSDAARNVMERENSVIQYESDQSAYLLLDQQSLIEKALAQSAYLRTSEQLASLIENEFEARLGRTSRGVKQAGFYVLWGASMPSILVEIGFVTNPEESAYLQSDLGQDYLAGAIFRAVRDFKAQYEKGVERVAK